MDGGRGADGDGEGPGEDEEHVDAAEQVGAEQERQRAGEEEREHREAGADLAVDERENGRLFADEEFLQHDAGTGRTERPAETRVHGGERVGAVLRHDHAFARGKAVRLHDELASGVILGVHIGAGVRGVVERGERGGRDAILIHELLGEILAAFELGGGLRGAEDRDAFRADQVGRAVAQGRFRADDHEVDAVRGGPVGNGGPVGAGDVRRAFGDLGDAGTAGDAHQAFRFRAELQTAADRVFAAAASEHEDIHNRGVSLRNMDDGTPPSCFHKKETR